MRIQTSKSVRPSPKKFAQAAKGDDPSLSSEPKPPAWRAITLNEAAVEIPQSLLELSGLDSRSPLAAKGLQAGVAGLAAWRAAQAFHDAKSVEEYLEGASSAALSVAGAASLLPAGSAGLLHRSFMVAHGASELALGVREIREELKKDSPARLELAAGVLDAVKGASTFLPLVFPATSDAVNVFQIGAILTKTAMEPMMERSRQNG